MLGLTPPLTCCVTWNKPISQRVKNHPPCNTLITSMREQMGACLITAWKGLFLSLFTSQWVQVIHWDCLIESLHSGEESTGSAAAAAAAKLLQSCPTLCDPIDGSPPGSPVPGILQARTLEWVAIFSSNAWKWKVKVKSLSRVRLLATPWTAAYRAPPSMGFSRQEYNWL